LSTNHESTPKNKKIGYTAIIFFSSVTIPEINPTEALLKSPLQKQDQRKASPTIITFTNFADDTSLMISAAKSIGKIQ